MAKNPKRHDDNGDEEFDSNKHREANKAKIEAENKENEQVAKETAENQEIANFKGFPVAGETRDQLLERIRKMRDEEAKIKEGQVEIETFRSEGMLKEFEAEQKAGQEAVAKAKEEQERNRALWQKQEEGEKNQAG